MPAPDFLQSRRQLRRARVQSALALPHKGVNLRLHRDRLIERLVGYADQPVSEFDSLPDSVVDTTVSLALTHVDERATDALSVMLLCMRVLAPDGQFARLKLLAPRLRILAGRVELERPYLHLATLALALALESQEGQALGLLDERLGEVGNSRAKAGAEPETLRDLLVAVTLQRLLRGNDVEFALRSRSAALRTNDGFMLAHLDAIISWKDAVERARPLAILTAADQVFQTPQLMKYVAQRGLSTLFPAQIHAISSGATLDQNTVVSLPTSSGKTLLAEFRVAATLARHQGSVAIYVAPYRLLARQVEDSFSKGLRTLGHQVKDLGAGYDPTSPEGTEAADVIICTPEHLDAIMRLSTTSISQGQNAAAALLGRCSLIVFDELQLIGRAGRGASIEMVLTRFKLKYPEVSILGLSASSASVNELSLWLTGRAPISGARRPTGTLEIVWETDGRLMQRVEPRATKVEELPRSTKALSDATALILKLDRLYWPVLALETSRPAAERLAAAIGADSAEISEQWRASLDVGQIERLNKAVEQVKYVLGPDHPLAHLMENGIAYHHAGVPAVLLESIEHLAARDCVRVVCATTTVAEGADLPFRVVVLPHLNFQGDTNRLERDLYLNIVGRAGRANVSMEGVVFVLNSDAATLRSLVHGTLWSSEAEEPVTGRLSDISGHPGSGSLEDFYAFQSQVMGWLGDGLSYVDNQASELASSTFTWRAGSESSKARITSSIAVGLSDLEQRGYALAASPYRLTDRGKAARLTGLGITSVARLERAIAHSSGGWLAEIADITEISETIATMIARLLFESVEITEQSLWLKRSSNNEAVRAQYLANYANGAPVPDSSLEVHKAEISMMAAWIRGANLATIAAAGPRFTHASALFGGLEEWKRTSDAAQYLGNISYHAGWVWSGVRVLCSAHHQITTPKFIRDAVEYGLPSESATRVARFTGMTRPAALAISRAGGSDWDACRGWLESDDFEYMDDLALPLLDTERIIAMRERDL